MAHSIFRRLTGFLLLLALFYPAFAMAQEAPPKDLSEASFASRCEKAEPKCADSPPECKSHEVQSAADKKVWRYPVNCLFLSEPIGGRPGYDLFKQVPVVGSDGSQVKYELWNGGAIISPETGPFQAILAYEKGKEYQGPFALLYNYLGLVYNYMSGIIIAFVILVTIIGGIRIITSGGAPDGMKQGKDMIVKALIGMVLWFTASVILYTINPTFFAF